jgi:alpha-beta hydrolase superfamily lysophospholipase
VGEFYRARGFLAFGLRLPAHGTVPGALAAADWEDWRAATRLAVREARRQVAAGPLHLVGYSNGGALALNYALDAVGEATLPRPDRLVLISPMVGISAFARFAGLAGLPALLPAFAKAAWLDIAPEFNPFKYNSFPVNGAVQSWRLTQALQRQLREQSGRDGLASLPPILAFQSVLDSTVSTRAVVEALFARLPANGSELVLYDVNAGTRLDTLFNPGIEARLDGLLPAAPRAFRATIIGAARRDTLDAVAWVTEAGEAAERPVPLGLAYPAGFFSLSHIALPFPPSDGLYGSAPDPAEDFGVRLGTLAPRGERGALLLDLDALLRASSNPFFEHLLGRIGAGLPPPG